MIVDNSGHKNVYEFYKILAKYWSHKLTGIDLKLLTEDKQVITLERDFVSIQFFIVKIVFRRIFSFFKKNQINVVKRK